MPTDRLFRFSVSGLMFLMTFVLFHSFSRGISIEEILQGHTDLLDFALVFFSIPVIGVIISTIGMGLLFSRDGYLTFFYLPDVSTTEGKYIIEKVLGENKRSEFANTLLNELSNSGTIDWHKEGRIRKFFTLYEASAKRGITQEQIKYLERRWSTYWTHTNNIFSIAFAFVIVLIERLIHCGRPYSIDVYQFFAFAFLLAYVVFASIHKTKTRKDANDAEHTFIIQYFDGLNKPS